MSQAYDNTIKVMIVDDHILYRTGVRTTLSIKNDIKVIGEADNGQHLLNMIKGGMMPDVILLDIQMPVMDGVAALKELKKLYPEIKVVMLTLLDNHTVVTKLMELGANGFLVKTSDADIIYEAIKTCFRQEYYFNALTNKAMLLNLRQNSVRTVHTAGLDDAKLNDKEITVLQMMCEEKTTREIAEHLHLSPRTIEAIRDKLKTKTGTKSTAGLIMYAVKNKLLNENI